MGQLPVIFYCYRRSPCFEIYDADGLPLLLLKRNRFNLCSLEKNEFVSIHIVFKTGNGASLEQVLNKRHYECHSSNNLLTHCGRDKMAASNVFF